jgi:hypothetical protein
MKNSKEYQKKWYQEHKEYYQKYRKKYGDSYTPEQRRAYHVEYRKNNVEKERARAKRYYQKHREEIKERTALWRQNPEVLQMLHQRRVETSRRLKIEVLTHYGNGKFACVQCGENRFPCLSIDHMNGKGFEHRQQLGHNRAGGAKIYRWLKEQAYPGGYQTLCMNCQWSKKYENKEFSNGRIKA